MKRIKNLTKKLGLYKYLKNMKTYFHQNYNSNDYTDSYGKEKLFYSELIKPYDLIFDIGANIGDKSEFFLTLGRKVIAIEPNTKSYHKLVKRFKDKSQIEIKNVGLSDEVGQKELLICEYADTLSTMSEAWTAESRFAKNYDFTKKEIVKVITINDLIMQYGIPDYCKIDVEGYEENILSVLTTSIPLISFEFVSEFLGKSKKIIERLNALSIIKINVVLNNNFDFEYPEFLAIDEFLNEIDKYNLPNLMGEFYIKMAPKNLNNI